MDASSSQSVSDTDSIFPEIPHQPRAFHFPKREFGKKSAVRRSFQTAWFDKWLLKAAKKEFYDDDIEFITQLYGSDLNLQQLKLYT